MPNLIREKTIRPAIPKKTTTPPGIITSETIRIKEIISQI